MPGNNVSGLTALELSPPTAALVVVDDEEVDHSDVVVRVEVVAPTTLPGNYELHCDFQGRPVVVRVPPEGVKQGDKFVGEVISQQSNGEFSSSGAHSSGDNHRIPTGEWRDGCCDCFKHGLCHPMLCLACWCPPLALGQVMTRLNLSATKNYGRPIPEQHGATRPRSAFKVLTIVFISYLAIERGLAAIVQPYMKSLQTTEGNTVQPDLYYSSNVPAFVWVADFIRNILPFVFWIYMLMLLIRTRYHVRQRYHIPERYSPGCEDCCCAFWCPCCTTLQMARHTADYYTYQAACCTETGLPPHAPHVV